MTDDSLKGTPLRVAKMYVNEIFGGLRPDKKPVASTFKNSYKYGEMLVEKNITVISSNSNQVIVSTGLEDGDRVVVSPVPFYINGMSVKPILKP